MLPSVQYLTPSQVTVEGRHMPSAHFTELFKRQPTAGSAKYIIQDTYVASGFKIFHSLCDRPILRRYKESNRASAYSSRSPSVQRRERRLSTMANYPCNQTKIHISVVSQSALTSTVRNVALFKAYASSRVHSAGNSDPPLLRNVATVV